MKRKLHSRRLVWFLLFRLLCSAFSLYLERQRERQRGEGEVEQWVRGKRKKKCCKLQSKFIVFPRWMSGKSNEMSQLSLRRPTVCALVVLLPSTTEIDNEADNARQRRQRQHWVEATRIYMARPCTLLLGHINFQSKSTGDLGRIGGIV